MKKTNDSSVNFKCPNCLKAHIVRNRHERAAGIKYTCGQCGFTGPN